MYLTGFADEAASDLGSQVRITQALGWRHIEARTIDGVNIHDLPETAFDQAAAALEAAGVQVNCFGSTIGNWSKRIDDPFEATLAEVERAIPRMQRLGTKLIRVMSYAQHGDGAQQRAQERFRRLREVKARFDAAGITAVHENCMNYGGMCWQNTLELVRHVPGLKLVFDTGNPVFARDRGKPAPHPYQDSWEFYSRVKEHVAYVHVKDAVIDERDQCRYCYPGEGKGCVRPILEDLKRSGYDGGISIEPHMASVFHDPDAGTAPADQRAANYLEYGRRLMAMLDELGWQRSA